ncbi:helix-turn-helix domain-containing protein [Microbacterium aurantiacum]|uniref:helix-turn-helix domain-containing protein n=1 Tax=Microbacterium aurantiacum TaxID=162393 RepID=UPI000C7F7C72
MNELTVRLSSIDAEAGEALAVIAHFDSLVASRAGLQSIVRGAASLAKCPVQLVDPGRRLTVRVLADGLVAQPGDPPDAEWPSEPVGSDGARIWLERPGPAGTVGAMILERAAAAALTVVQRTRAIYPADDPALVEVILDAGAAEADRVVAARRLGLSGPARAACFADGSTLLIPGGAPFPPDRRMGVGPLVDVLDLPGSHSAAQLALRLTAEGTEHDPGPRVVYADELGSVAILIQAADTSKTEMPDLTALMRAGATAPWMFATCEAICWSESLRAAARALHLHHSTLQDRLEQAERALGWDIREPHGRLRLQLALLLRRASRSPSHQAVREGAR